MRFIGFAVVTTLAMLFWASGTNERALEARESEFGGIQPGDLVFQDLECGLRCALIRRMTRSRYTHVGIVLEEDGERVVWEAYAPVGHVPLAEWVARGRQGLLAVYRPSGAWDQDRVAAEVRLQAGRPYDGDYQWDEARIYCSELIAKAYERAAGESVFPPHTVDLGQEAPRIARLTGGRLTPETQMVTPYDLTQHPGIRRVVDQLADDR